MSEKTDAIRVLCNEQKAMRVTKAGYRRCKYAVQVLGLGLAEQAIALKQLEFEAQVKADPAYARVIREVLRWV